MYPKQFLKMKRQTFPSKIVNKKAFYLKKVLSNNARLLLIRQVIRFCQDNPLKGPFLHLFRNN